MAWELMAAQRKILDDSASRGGPLAGAAAARTGPEPSGSRPAGVKGDEQPVPSPAHALQARLIGAYDEPQVDKWPPAVRLAVMLGSAAALWGLVAGAAFVAVSQF